MPQWGATTTDESKPKETWIRDGGSTMFANTSTGNNSANVYATKQGWVIKRPWGEEVLVAIGGLDTNLGVPTYTGVDAGPAIANAAAQIVEFTLTWNEPLAVSGSPTVLAIGAAGAANSILTYSSALSEPLAGKLVFRNASVNLAAIPVGGTLTINATSGVANFVNFANITDFTSAASITSALTGYSATLTIVAA